MKAPKVILVCQRCLKEGYGELYDLFQVGWRLAIGAAICPLCPNERPSGLYLRSSGELAAVLGALALARAVEAAPKRTSSGAPP